MSHENRVTGERHFDAVTASPRRLALAPHDVGPVQIGHPSLLWSRTEIPRFDFQPSVRCPSARQPSRQQVWYRMGSMGLIESGTLPIEDHSGSAGSTPTPHCGICHAECRRMGSIRPIVTIKLRHGPYAFRPVVVVDARFITEHRPAQVMSSATLPRWLTDSSGPSDSFRSLSKLTEKAATSSGTSRMITSPRKPSRYSTSSSPGSGNSRITNGP